MSRASVSAHDKNRLRPAHQAVLGGDEFGVAPRLERRGHKERRPGPILGPRVPLHTLHAQLSRIHAFR